MFWACHINKMYFRPNHFFHVDFDNLTPQIRKNKNKRRLHFTKQGKLIFLQGFKNCQ